MKNMKKKEKEKSYRTQQIIVKSGHRLHPYFKGITENAKNLYNTTNFYFRQIFTAMTSTKSLQPLQQEVLKLVEENLEAMNAIKYATYEKKRLKELEKAPKEQKEIKLSLFEMPSTEKPYVNFTFLDGLFKASKQNDYRSLPTQTSQAVMKTVFSTWKSFFESIKEYKANPSRFSGKPNIPRYIKASQKEAEFSNQDCVIKDNRFLKFPKTKERLNIGKLGSTTSDLKCVRVIPKYDFFVVELVFEVPTFEKNEAAPSRMMAIDLGIDNLATITTNTGMSPILLKGKNIKSINQYYNKKRAHLYSILRQGKQPKEGLFTSKRLQRLDVTRFRKLKDIFHKVSFFIRELAEFEQIDTIVIGKNKGWKQESNMGRKNNQKFVQIPHSLLINLITYKAEEYGINVLVTEESYTSKASFLDMDFIPTYKENDNEQSFSGKRVKRGLYRSKNKTLINADVNGSANIMRKFATKKGVTLNIEDIRTEQPVSFVYA